MTFLPRGFNIVALTLLSISHSFASGDFSGYWRTFDDVTGSAKSIVQVTKGTNGLYSGRIVEIIPVPDYTPIETCQKCPEPFTDKKILGLIIAWNFRVDSDAAENTRYEGGYVLDPLSGKIYQGHATINADGRGLRLRGHIIGAPMIGRSQTWRRENNYNK